MAHWVKFHDKFLTWEWYSDSQMVHLFIHLLLKANYENKRWKGIDVHRGQMIFGRKKVAETLGISEQTLRTCMNKLKSTNEITIKSTNKYSLVTIVKYEDYQESKTKSTSKSTNKLTNDQPTTNQQLTTPIEYNNTINSNNTMSGRADRFVEFVNSTFNKNYKTGRPVILQNFRARIETDKYPPELLAEVAMNVKNTTFHIESQYKYATPEFLLKQSTIEKYKSGPIVKPIFKTETVEPKPNQKYDEQTNIYSDFQ